MPGYFEERRGLAGALPGFAEARTDFSAAIDLRQARGGLEKCLTVERPPAELARRIEDARPKSDLPR